MTGQGKEYNCQLCAQCCQPVVVNFNLAKSDKSLMKAGLTKEDIEIMRKFWKKTSGLSMSPKTRFYSCAALIENNDGSFTCSIYKTFCL